MKNNQNHWFESILEKFNKLLHEFIAVALLFASFLLMWEFSRQVYTTILSGNVAIGFLHALGNLFILWVLSSLIAAEVRWMKTGHFSVIVFIEAALITLLRQLIIIPVESSGHIQQQALAYGLVTFAIIGVGLTYYLVWKQQQTRSNSNNDTEDSGTDSD